MKVLIIDAEAIGRSELLSVAVVSLQFAEDNSECQEVKKKRFSFQTQRTLKEREQYWNSAPLGVTRALSHAPKHVQELLKKHVDFDTPKQVEFWIRNHVLLSKLNQEAKEQNALQQKWIRNHATEKSRSSAGDSSKRHWRTTRKLLYKMSLRRLHAYIRNEMNVDSDVFFLGDNCTFDIGLLEAKFQREKLASIRFHPETKHYVKCKEIYSLLEGRVSMNCKLQVTSVMTVQSLLSLLISQSPMLKLDIPKKPTDHDPLEDCMYVAKLYEVLLHS